MFQVGAAHATADPVIDICATAVAIHSGSDPVGSSSDSKTHELVSAIVTSPEAASVNSELSGADGLVADLVFKTI